MNYLSEKIERLDGCIDELRRLAALSGDYGYSLKKVSYEKEMLENILNKLTIIELSVT